jgi:hypothetical protein
MHLKNSQKHRRPEMIRMRANISFVFCDLIVTIG